MREEGKKQSRMESFTQHLDSTDAHVERSSGKKQRKIVQHPKMKIQSSSSHRHSDGKSRFSDSHNVSGASQKKCVVV